MTQIDFYVLPDATPRGRALFVCRLAEKVFKRGQRSFVQLATENEARELDELMWTFHDRSFLPHALAAAGDDVPVLLGCGAEPAGDWDLLINLTAAVPAFFSRFARVAEVVDAAPEIRALGRERFRFYKDRGYAVETHQM